MTLYPFELMAVHELPFFRIQGPPLRLVLSIGRTNRTMGALRQGTDEFLLRTLRKLTNRLRMNGLDYVNNVCIKSCPDVWWSVYVVIPGLFFFSVKKGVPISVR